MPLPYKKETTRSITFRLPLPVMHELERMSERERLSLNQACIRSLEKGLNIDRPTP